MLRAIAFILLFFCFGNIFSQSCEWITRNDASSSVFRYGTNSTVVSTTVDSDNNIVAAGNFYLGLQFDSVLRQTSNYTSGFITKLNPDGKPIWTYNTSSINGVTLAGFNFYDVAIDKNGCTYAVGRVLGNTTSNTVFFGNGNVISTSQADIAVLIKLDSVGKLLWVERLPLNSITNGYSGGSNLLERTLSVVVDSKNNPIVSYTTNRAYRSIAQPTGITVIKYSPIGASLNEIEILDSNSLYHTTFSNDMGIDAADNLYLLGYSTDAFEFMGNTLNSSSGVLLLKLNASLQPVTGVQIKTFENVIADYSTHYSRLSVDEKTGNLAIIGNFDDTIDFDGSTLYPSKAINSYIAFYNANLDLKWVKSESSTSNNMKFSHVILKDSLIYIGANIPTANQSNSFIHFDTISENVINPGFLFLNLDITGNLKWYYKNNFYHSYPTNFFNGLVSLSIDTSKKLIAVGNFGFNFRWPSQKTKTNDLTILNRTSKGIKKYRLARDFFVAKITPTAIYRGIVDKGPYCAGDTINIPYNKTGRFNPSNIFIAQLSDSAGNFDGNETYLGSSADTGSGIIKGVLPFLNIPTSNKYRIRVIATSPYTESYYRQDTLQFLIYSRDTANAGRDTTICSGQPVTLNVTGGSQWSWSPSIDITSPSDSTQKHVTVTPSITTNYKVIISDSSGCGLTDTDYVKISVRPKINSQIIGADTICRNVNTTIIANATGGKGLGYNYTWQQRNAGNYSTITSGKANKLTVNLKETTSYRVITIDNCTIDNDTAYYTLIVDTALNMLPIPDTTICKGKTITLKAKGNGCLPSRYAFHWIEKGTSSIISTTDSLIINPLITTTYVAVLRDTVAQLYDTLETTVFVDDLFSVTTKADTTVCYKEQLHLTASIVGCDTSLVTYVWKQANSPTVLSRNKVFSPQNLTGETYTVVAKNGFNGLTDSTNITVTVRPPLNIAIIGKDSICPSENNILTASFAGGDSSAYSFQWFAASGAVLPNRNPLVVAPQNTTTYITILEDNCSPIVRDSFKVYVVPQPNANFSINNTVGCAPLKINIEDNSNNHDSLLNRWIIPNTGEVNGISSLSQVFTQSGNYNFSLKVFNKWGCESLANSLQNIVVYKQPKADFIITPKIKETDSEIRLTNTGSITNNYLWYMGNGAEFSQKTHKDTLYQYQDSGSYTVRLVSTNGEGCKDTFERTITVFDKSFCTIPSAFTPNGDGYNNTFAPVCNGIANYTLTIYNRWGQVITNCNNCGWNGTYIEQPVPSGVYMYLIETHAYSNKKETIYGTVNLLR